MGSLILGLYDKKSLIPIGHTSGLKAKEKRELVKKLAPYETARSGSDPSRWDSDRELEWRELRPELVIEITYDHTSGGRIRHGSKIALARRQEAARMRPRSARLRLRASSFLFCASNSSALIAPSSRSLASFAISSALELPAACLT